MNYPTSAKLTSNRLLVLVFLFHTSALIAADYTKDELHYLEGISESIESYYEAIEKGWSSKRSESVNKIRIFTGRLEKTQSDFEAIDYEYKGKRFYEWYGSYLDAREEEKTNYENERRIAEEKRLADEAKAFSSTARLESSNLTNSVEQIDISKEVYLAERKQSVRLDMAIQSLLFTVQSIAQKLLDDPLLENDTGYVANLLLDVERRIYDFTDRYNSPPDPYINDDERELWDTFTSGYKLRKEKLQAIEEEARQAELREVERLKAIEVETVNAIEQFRPINDRISALESAILGIQDNRQILGDDRYYESLDSKVAEINTLVKDLEAIEQSSDAGSTNAIRQSLLDAQEGINLLSVQWEFARNDIFSQQVDQINNDLFEVFNVEDIGSGTRNRWTVSITMNPEAFDQREAYMKVIAQEVIKQRNADYVIVYLHPNKHIHHWGFFLGFVAYSPDGGGFAGRGNDRVWKTEISNEYPTSEELELLQLWFENREDYLLPNQHTDTARLITYIAGETGKSESWIKDTYEALSKKYRGRSDSKALASIRQKVKDRRFKSFLKEYGYDGLYPGEFEDFIESIAEGSLGLDKAKRLILNHNDGITYQLAQLVDGFAIYSYNDELLGYDEEGHQIAVVQEPNRFYREGANLKRAYYGFRGVVDFERTIGGSIQILVFEELEIP